MYRQITNTDPMKSSKCPKCGCTRLLYASGALKCTDCGYVIGKTFNKYNAKRTEFNGKMFDSKFEANVAQDLETRKRAGDIKDYDTQYRVEADICNSQGEVVCHKRHKVDFRLHHNDGSYELLEAKGVETSDYRWRRDIIVGIWLSEHRDYIYTVIKQNDKRRIR